MASNKPVQMLTDLPEAAQRHTIRPKIKKYWEVNNLKLQMGKELTAQEIANGNEASRNLIAAMQMEVLTWTTNRLCRKLRIFWTAADPKDTIRQMLQAAGASDTQTEYYYISLIDDTYDN